MAFAETANLAVKLSLSGNFTSQMAKARASLRGLDRESRGFKAGAQIGTGIRRGAILAVAGIGALTALVAQSVKDGQEAANVQKVYAQAIANSGKVSQDYVAILNDQQKALMDLAGVDDELIKTEQTRLIQMGLTGKQVAKATPLILDFAKATGIDLLTATKLFGKAAQGNVGALSRYGVQIDKAKAKVDPFGAAIDALNGKFGGTTKALSGSLDTRLAAFREGLRNIREEAGIKLLPVLTRIVDVAGKELVPAFAKFVDRILPQLEDGLNGFADLLSNGGAAKGISAITDALGPMVELVKIAAAPVKAIVDAFLKLPKEVQTVLVGAFAVNKLTGGLVTNAAGGLVEALGKAVIGGIKAPLVNVQGGVVNVAGGIPGGGGAGAVGAVGGTSKLVKGLAGLSILADIGAVIATQQAVSGASSEQARGVTETARVYLASSPTTDELATSLAAVDTGIERLQSNPLYVLVQGSALDELRKTREAIVAQQKNINGGNIGARTSGGGNTPDKPIVKNTSKTVSAVEAAKAAIAAASKAAATKAAAQQAKLEATRQAINTSSSSAKSSAGNIAARISASGAATASALRNLPVPIVTTNVETIVNVTANGITKIITTQSHYGPAGGSSSDPRFLGYQSGI